MLLVTPSPCLPVSEGSPAPRHPRTLAQRGTDDAHLALEDIDELGISSILRTESSGRSLQLAQEATDAGDAGIVLAGDARSPTGRIGHHGAKFVKGERLAVLADAPDAVEDGAGRVEFNGDSYSQPQGQGKEHGEKGNEEVKGAFECHIIRR